MPPQFDIAERRMAQLAVAAWQAGRKVRVEGFDDNSLVIAHADGMPVVTACAEALAAAFGLVTGMVLTARDGLVGELVATCDLVTLRPEPAPFEASMSVPGRALLLVRGVALPLFDRGRESGELQVVLSWREVLNRAATTRLRREIGAVLRHLRPFYEKSDPFPPDSSG